MYQQGIQEVNMDPNETTALICTADDAPTIEFTLPPRDEPYTSEEIPETIIIEPTDETQSERIPLSRILRRTITGLLICVTLTVAGICIGHAVSDIRFEPDSIPAALLTTLSAGEVHAAEIVPDNRKITAADLPDTGLNPVAAPETAETEPDEPREPSPLTITNETPYTPDPDAILAKERAVPPLEQLTGLYGENAPVVLILSTHATESYAGHEDTNYRTTDDSENVIRTASVIAEILENAGIGVIHCKTRFDEDDFTMAYYNASLEIRAQLRDHPSVQYIIDVHRDSVQANDGTYLAMESDGLAQLMFVVGTDHGGSGHTGWEDNLALAARLHTAMESENPGLMRSLNLRSASFNQQYTKGSLILEIGSCAGSLEGALKSAEIFANALADEIIG